MAVRTRQLFARLQEKSERKISDHTAYMVTDLTMGLGPDKSRIQET